MSAVMQTKAGEIIFSDDYIASLAGLAATECYGVVGMSPKKVWDSVAEVLGRDNLKKGVKVYTDESSAVKIELHIVVEYGTSISALGTSIIQTVRYQVEKATGLNVKDVNVVVSGIRVG